MKIPTLSELRQLGYFKVPSKGDGGCWYRTVSTHKYGTEERHEEIRLGTVDYLSTPPVWGRLGEKQITTDDEDQVKGMCRVHKISWQGV